MFYTTMSARDVLTIGQDIEVRVAVKRTKNDQYARVAVQAPREIDIRRGEIQARVNHPPDQKARPSR